MYEPHIPTGPRVAVLGADAVVAEALAALLQHAGFGTCALGPEHLDGRATLPRSVRLLVLAPGPDLAWRVTVMGDWNHLDAERSLCILDLTDPASAPVEPHYFSLRWPCPLSRLTAAVEAALAG